VNARQQAPPPFGEAERRAWRIVLDAIEEAIDVDGLQGFDRGRLSEMHERATWHIGIKPVTVPGASSDPAFGTPEYWQQQHDRYMSWWQAFNGPGGIGDLDRALPSRPLFALARLQTVARISELEAMTDDEILALPGIGVKSLAEIRAAINRYQAETGATAGNAVD
jgi:hypothetical protein